LVKISNVFAYFSNAAIITNKMRIKLLTIFLLILNFAYCQVKDILSVSALILTEQEVTYDRGYFSIDYPDGDFPSDKGVKPMTIDCFYFL